MLEDLGVATGRGVFDESALSGVGDLRAARKVIAQRRGEQAG
jgi:hypothetical protein